MILASGPSPLRGVHAPARLAALGATGLLDTAPEPAFDRLTCMASRLLGAPVAAMSLVDGRRQFFKSAIGLGEPWVSRRETPLSHSFCRHVVDGERPLVVADSHGHPLVGENLAVTELGVRAYLGVPLTASTGHVFGALCVVSGSVRSWHDEDVELMEEFARPVMTEVELRSALAEAKARAEEAERVAAELARKSALLEALLAGKGDAVAVTDEHRALALRNAAE
jgi:GAF domain-containing protein